MREHYHFHHKGLLTSFAAQVVFYFQTDAIEWSLTGEVRLPLGKSVLAGAGKYLVRQDDQAVLESYQLTAEGFSWQTTWMRGSTDPLLCHDPVYALRLLLLQLAPDSLAIATQDKIVNLECRRRKDLSMEIHGGKALDFLVIPLKEKKAQLIARKGPLKYQVHVTMESFN